jgi:hypothetical protein
MVGFPLADPIPLLFELGDPIFPDDAAPYVGPFDPFGFGGGL